MGEGGWERDTTVHHIDALHGRAAEARAPQSGEDSFAPHSSTPLVVSPPCVCASSFACACSPLLAISGVSFDTVAREWRMKWSDGDDKKSLQEIQKIVDANLEKIKKIDGVKDVQRVVCGVRKLAAEGGGRLNAAE